MNMKPEVRLFAVAAIAGALVSGGMHLLFSARADQSERVPPTSGIYTGVQFSQKIGDLARSVSTGNKGSSAPANVGGSAVDGLEWIDDSASPWTKKRYVNGGWAIEGYLNPSDSSYAGVIGGGLGSIASATTTDLGSVPQANVTITGSATITGFGSAAASGIEKTIRFDNALKLTNSAALAVPGGYDLITAANDRAKVTHLGSGNWEITTYTRANGIPVDVSSVGKFEMTSALAVPSLHLAGYGQAIARASYPAYVAKVSRAQNGTRISGSATISSVSDTSGFGAGMPVESTGVNAGCTIASVTSSSITLNSSACVTASGTSTVTVFPYGYGTGGDSTTIGVRDCRNYAIAGRDRNDPGSLANLLTSSKFGANSGLYNASGGAESVSITIAKANIPSYNLTSDAKLAKLFYTAPQVGQAGNNANFFTGFAADSNPGGYAEVDVSVGGQNVPSGGSGTALVPRTVQPTLIAECIVRVTP
jgi:hypothetical protein